jgi:diguanylate cyclase (GGDEF)-like protein/PAS domain S-box-containing protein
MVPGMPELPPPTGPADAGLLERLLAGSSDLVLVVDAGGVLTYVSGAAQRMLGRDPQFWTGRSAFDLVHPDDVGLAAEAMVTSAEGEAGTKAPLALRVLHADGTWRHVEIVANNLVDDPVVRGLLINARDLGERRQAVRDQAVRDRRFEEVFDRAPIGMALVGVDGRFVRVNTALARMAGRAPHELLSANMVDLVVPADRPRLIERARRTLAGERPDPIELRTARPDGRITWMRVSSTLVRDEDGTPTHGIAHVEDVTEQRLLREELEHRARHDVLTEALNRDGFAQHARRVLHGEGTAGLVVVDLDGFKRVNDRLGHAAGDELLVAVTARLRASVKASDAVARFGGDEFVLLLADVAPDELANVAERVRAALAEPFTLALGSAVVTGSVGTALVAAGEPLDAALARADAAAYRSKRGGGNAASAALEAQPASLRQGGRPDPTAVPRR